MIPSQLFAEKLYQAQENRTRTQISVRGSFYIALALMIFLMPLKWILSWIVACSVHELCHVAVLRCYRQKICSMSIGLGGATIVTEPLDNRIEFLAALAGPIGSLSLLCVSKYSPCIAICGFVHFFFNIIPIFPLDGGLAARCIVNKMFPAKLAPAIIRLIEWFVLFLFGTFSLYAAFKLRLGLLPVLCFTMLLLKIKFRNCPCK